MCLCLELDAMALVIHPTLPSLVHLPCLCLREIKCEILTLSNGFVNDTVPVLRTRTIASNEMNNAMKAPLPVPFLLVSIILKLSSRRYHQVGR